MTKPTEEQIEVACKEARAQLTALSGASWVNYNDEIADYQLQTFMERVLTAALAVQPLKGKQHHA